MALINPLQILTKATEKHKILLILNMVQGKQC